ncbi:MAG TPA: hypothetical protein VF375_02255 [Candidatus Limnocylindrales bacterium]
MDRTPPATHAAHDELLIARLFGGDVSDVEREHALDLLGECSECAALFVDLGDIADATEALPIPARPRDFSLTAADAARLSRRRWGWPTLSGASLRRSFGTSLAALGLVGLMLTATTSVFGGAGGLDHDSGSVTTAQRAVAPNAADNGAVALATSGAVASPASAPMAPSPDSQYAASSPASSPADVAVASAAAPTTDAKVVPAPVGSGYAGGSGSEVNVPEAGAGSGSAAGQGSIANGGGTDTRLVWLGGFGLLFAVGLIIILVPWLGRRRQIRP